MYRYQRTNNIPITRTKLQRSVFLILKKCENSWFKISTIPVLVYYIDFSATAAVARHVNNSADVVTLLFSVGTESL